MQGPRIPGPGVLHEPFGDIPEANIVGDQLTIGDDGSFELYIGGPATRSQLAAHHPGVAKAVHPSGF